MEDKEFDILDYWTDGKEIDRVKGFSDGEFSCIKCGKKFSLYWNGGELDQQDCCGIRYQTEHQDVDLVIYELRKHNTN